MNDADATTTIHVSNDAAEEWPAGDPRLQAHRALATALARMCRAAYERAHPRGFTPFRRGRACGPGIDYTWTDEMELVHLAMPAVLDGRITPDTAMGLLHSPDVYRARLAAPRKSPA